MIHNFRRRQADAASLVEWKIANEPVIKPQPTVLEHGDNLMDFDKSIVEPSLRENSSVSINWIPHARIEQAIISINPNKSWRRYYSAVFEISVRNYYVSEPQLTLRKKLIFLFEPSQPRFELLQGGVPFLRSNEAPFNATDAERMHSG